MCGDSHKHNCFIIVWTPHPSKSLICIVAFFGPLWLPYQAIKEAWHGPGSDTYGSSSRGATWWQQTLQVSPLSGHLVRHPIILASKTALPAQRPESQVHGGEIDWPCHTIVIDRQFLKAGPLMVIKARVPGGSVPPGGQLIGHTVFQLNNFDCNLATSNR